MSNPCTAAITLEGGSGLLIPGQPVNVTIVLTNPTSSVVNVQKIYPFATSNGQPYAGVIFGTPTTIGNVLAVPAAGQLTISFGLILTTPQGSAETGSAQANCATTAVVFGASIYTDDSNVLAPSLTLTPSQLGTAAPAAAGQFLFASPLNSPNIHLW